MILAVIHIICTLPKRQTAAGGVPPPPSALPSSDPEDGSPEAAPGDEEGRRIEVAAAGLKAYASRHCVETVQACREACGGQGYLAANRLGRLRADTDVFTTFEGANAVLLQLVAKGLLSQYREEMGDLRLWGLVKHVADRAQTRLTEMNPLTVRRTEPEHLRDPDFHAAAFAYREERLLASAGRRLHSLIEEGTDSFEAMNHCQDHLLQLAEAHVERVVLGAFLDSVARAPSPAASERDRRARVAMGAVAAGGRPGLVPGERLFRGTQGARGADRGERPLPRGR